MEEEVFYALIGSGTSRENRFKSVKRKQSFRAQRCLVKAMKGKYYIKIRNRTKTNFKISSLFCNYYLAAAAASFQEKAQVVSNDLDDKIRRLFQNITSEWNKRKGKRSVTPRPFRRSSSIEVGELDHDKTEN